MGEQGKREIVDICHKLYEHGYLVATSGNVSARTKAGLLITPKATRKDTIASELIVECDENGLSLDPEKKPSSETEMHRAAYQARPEINAAIHAHPRYCVTCTMLGISLTDIIVPELIVYTGPAPTVPYAMPGSSEQAEAVKPYLEDHNAFLLERHGVLILGSDLNEAFSRLEQLEYAANIAYLVSVKGQTDPLPINEIKKIVARAKENGFKPTNSIMRLLD